MTASRGYNGTADANGQVTNVTLTGQQNGENISVALPGAVYNAASVADANAITITYTITAAGGAKLANYRVKIADADAVDAAALMTETVGAAITAAPVTVTIADQSAVYDGAKPEVGNQQNIHWRVTQGTIYQLVAGTDDDLGIELDIADTAKDVNTYSITGTAGNQNYQVSFVNGEFTVTARSLYVTIGSAAGYYGDAPDVSAVGLTYQQTQG